MSEQLSFPGIRAGEEVLARKHRHWLFLLPDLLATLAALIVPLGILIAVSALGGTPFEEPARNFVVTLGSLYYLAVVTFFFIRWLDYYLDLAIVTDQRVVDIDQHGLFRRNVAELEYEVVQDVTSVQNGILQTLFNFGDVEIQTAGEQANFTFRTIARPEEVVNQINTASKREEQADEQREQETAEKMGEAAEAMKEAAEGLQHAAPAEPGREPSPADEPSKPPERSTSPPPTAPPPPPADSSPPPEKSQPADDIPREYER